MSERKLRQWLDAGLIDAATQQRILDYEAKTAKPLGLWAIIGLGALAVGLGIISVVAANWDDIPGLIRLSVHALLIVALMTGIYLQKPRNGFLGLHLEDVLLFIWAVLGLSFFGHLGQVYQTSSPLWQPLLAWLVLFGPVMLLLGRGWLIALLIMAGVIGTAVQYLDWYSSQAEGESTLVLAALTSVPLFTTVAAILMRARTDRDMFWRQIAQISLVVLIFGVTLKLIFVGLVSGEFFGSEAIDRNIAFLHTAIWTIGAAVIASTDRSRRNLAIAGILTISGLINLISTLIQSSHELVAGMIFMTFWAAIGAFAIYAGWRKIFQVAVALVAIRLIILSFELATDLLASGFGLILAGLITIGVAVGAYRFSKAFAPERGADQSGEEA